MSKKPKLEVESPETPKELELEETADYVIIVEAFHSSRSVGGIDAGYGILNKHSGVVDLRFGNYAEALQGLIMLQEAYDKYMAEFKRKTGGLN